MSHDMPELKPCPFCRPANGCLRYFVYPPPQGPIEHIIVCENCGCSQRAESEESVCEKWNSRPIEAALEAKVKAIRDSAEKRIVAIEGEAERLQPYELGKLDAYRAIVCFVDGLAATTTQGVPNAD